MRLQAWVDHASQRQSHLLTRTVSRQPRHLQASLACWLWLATGTASPGMLHPARHTEARKWSHRRTRMLQVVLLGLYNGQRLEHEPNRDVVTYSRTVEARFNRLPPRLVQFPRPAAHQALVCRPEEPLPLWTTACALSTACCAFA